MSMPSRHPRLTHPGVCRRFRPADLDAAGRQRPACRAQPPARHPWSLQAILTGRSRGSGGRGRGSARRSVSPENGVIRGRRVPGVGTIGSAVLGLPGAGRALRRRAVGSSGVALDGEFPIDSRVVRGVSGEGSFDLRPGGLAGTQGPRRGRHRTRRPRFAQGGRVPGRPGPVLGFSTGGPGRQRHPPRPGGWARPNRSRASAGGTFCRGGGVIRGRRVPGVGTVGRGVRGSPTAGRATRRRALVRPLRGLLVRCPPRIGVKFPLTCVL